MDRIDTHARIDFTFKQKDHLFDHKKKIKNNKTKQNKQTNKQKTK